jgi:hypothetical protein
MTDRLLPLSESFDFRRHVGDETQAVSRIRAFDQPSSLSRSRQARQPLGALWYDAPIPLNAEVGRQNVFRMFVPRFRRTRRGTAENNDPQDSSNIWRHLQPSSR